MTFLAIQLATKEAYSQNWGISNCSVLKIYDSKLKYYSNFAFVLMLQQGFGNREQIKIMTEQASTDIHLHIYVQETNCILSKTDCKNKIYMANTTHPMTQAPLQQITSIYIYLHYSDTNCNNEFSNMLALDLLCMDAREPTAKELPPS